MNKIITGALLNLFLIFTFCQVYGQGIEITSPKVGQFVSSEINITWNRVDTASYYQLIVSRDSIFSDLYLDTITVNSRIRTLPNRGTSYLKIYGYNKNGKVDSSKAIPFNYYLPIFEDSLKYWVLGDSGVTHSNDSVSEWLDQSTYAHSAVQTNASFQPKLVLNDINGHDVIDFDYDVLPDVVSINSSKYYISAIYNFHESSMRPVRLINAAVAGSNWVMAPYNTHIIANGFGFVGSGLSIVKDEYVLNAAYFNDDSLQHRVNSKIITQTTTGKIPGLLSIGTSLFSNRMNGSVAEIVMMEGLVSSLVVDSIESYLMDKYAPPLNLGVDKIVCQLPYELSANRNTYKTYTWGNSTSDTSITINNPGTFYLTVTDIFGRESSDSIKVEVDSVYKHTLAKDTTICFGEELYIDLGGSDFFNYQWNDGTSGKFKTISTPGSYTLTVTDCSNRVYVDSINVSISNINFNLLEDTIICQGDSITLSPDTFFQNVNYLWSGGTSDSILTVNQTGSYTLSISDSVGCLVQRNSSVTVDSTFFGSTLGPDTTLCEGNEIGLLEPINGATYLWSTQNTDSVIGIDSSGLYTLDISNDNCSFSDSISVTVKGKAPSFDFSFNSTCFSDSTYFTSISLDTQSITANNALWIINDLDSIEEVNPKFLFDTIGLHKVELQVVNDSGCIGSLTKSVFINDKPKPNFSVYGYCQGVNSIIANNSTINTDSISSHVWHLSLANSLLSVDTAESLNQLFLRDTIYQLNLIATSSAGCIDSTSKSISINSQPIPSFFVTEPYVNDTTHFINSSTINKGMINQYEWYIGDLDTSFLENPKYGFMQTGIFEITLKLTSDSMCQATFVDSIAIKPYPSTFENIKPIRNAYTSSPVRFEWNYLDSAHYYELFLYKDNKSNLIQRISNLFFSELEVSDLSSGTYYWNVAAYRDQLVFDSTQIDSFIVFNPNENESIRLWLTGESAIANGNNRVYAWENLALANDTLFQSLSTAQPFVLDSALNNYAAVGFDSTRKTFQNVIDIDTQNYLVSMAYNSTTNIPRTSRLLTTGSGALTWILGPYTRHNLANSLGFTGFGKPIEQNRYVVSSAVSYNDSLSHFVNNINYSKVASGDNPGILHLGANTNGYFLGNLLEVIIYENNADSALRVASDAYLMDKYAPKFPLGPDRKVCQFPDSISVDESSYVSYKWNTGDSSSTIMVDSAGLYIVELEDIFERIYIDSIIIELDTSSIHPSFGFDTLNLCEGERFQLSINANNNYRYKWNTGDSTKVIIVDSTSIYSVEVENCLSNKLYDSVFVQFNKPEFSLGNDTTICFNQLINLEPDSSFVNVSYAWNTAETISRKLADTSGIYILSVTDSYQCQFSDTISIQIDSSIYGLSLGSDTSLCVGNQIALVNPNPSITSYLWSTGNTNSHQIIDTAGIYTLQVGNGRCFITDSIEISIKGVAPDADFTVNDLCVNDSVFFLNNSTIPSGDIIKAVVWNFGDGDSSNLTNPSHNYSSPTNYLVYFEVETDKGCFDTTTKTVVIEPAPKANIRFSNQPSCSKSLINIFDNSSISSGSIVSYQWNFGDTSSSSNTSIQMDPSHTFDTLGTYFIELIVETDQGCLDTIVKEMVINPTPKPSFAIEGFCLGDSTLFIDQTVLAKGEIIDYRWVFDSNNTESRKMNPKFQYNSSGEKRIALRVISDSLCQAIFYDTITISETPIASFNTEEYCAEIPFEIENTSISNDSIILYRYIFANDDTSFIENPTFQSDSAATYDLSLFVKTNMGCEDSTTSSVRVNSPPTANFNILNNATGVPFELKLENKSLNANGFIWSFGNGDSSQLELPTYTYLDTGNYSLQLKVYSDVGCIDSITKQVMALPFFLDATLERIELVETPTGALQVYARVLNSGFNTIEEIQLTADLNNEFQFRESVQEELFNGELFTYKFNSTFIQEEGRKVDFVCVRIEGVNGIQDGILSNNELCKEGFKEELFVKAYPNPTKDFLTLDYVLPNDGDLLITIHDGMGKQLLPMINRFVIEGYYSVKINVEGLATGIYHYSFIFNGIKRQGTFVKE